MAAPVIRTCIGCRKRACAAQLVRIVAATHGGVMFAVPDVARRLPGRGAWLHSDLSCLALAERRRVFRRALACIGPVDIGPIQEHYATQHVVTQRG